MVKVGTNVSRSHPGEDKLGRRLQVELEKNASLVADLQTQLNDLKNQTFVGQGGISVSTVGNTTIINGQTITNIVSQGNPNPGGEVTVSAGTNVTVTHNGNDYQVSATGGTAGVTSLNTETGDITLESSDSSISITAPDSHTIDITAPSVAVPLGAIIFWPGSAASIPAGFSLCDGTSGTPDLRGFILSMKGTAGTVTGTDLKFTSTGTNSNTTPGGSICLYDGVSPATQYDVATPDMTHTHVLTMDQTTVPHADVTAAVDSYALLPIMRTS